MFKNALVSVSDKTGLVDFLKPLYADGLRIVSTGGTAQHLKENGIAVTDISEQTSFPEVMGGRVKTLHPFVHMAILARGDHPEDFELLKKHGLQAFDLVICNLYPFEAAVEKNLQGVELIEKIDIGGPTVLRAAAKNFTQVAVVCDPADFKMLSTQKSLSYEERKKLAAKVFAHVSAYDALVARELGNAWGPEFAVGGHKVMDLRYGENPQQSAAWYRSLADNKGLHTAEILQGKVLSYNNLLDLDAATNLVRSFAEPAVVAVKHNNPCGVAIDPNLGAAFKKVIQSDSVSIFGGIIAANRKIDANEAELLGSLFLECVIAPDYTPAALQVFAKKKNLRILQWAQLLTPQSDFEMKSISGGFLLQTKDISQSDESNWKFSPEKPSAEILRDLLFGEKVCGSLKSNAIALVKDGQTLGLGMGQVNRVDSVHQAVERMNKNFPNTSDAILISDAFFPFSDSVEIASKAGVKWILQPGGSLKDEEVLAAAKKANINMVLSGVRHFKH